jgi:signal transduction histidine kinase
MSIKRRVILQQLVIAASILIVAAITYSSIRSTEFYLKRMGWAYQQLEAITSLKVSANRYSEQIAELILIGDPERPDFESASAELVSGFDRLERVTAEERSFLATWTQPDGGLDELHRIERMRALYQQINASVVEVLALLARGQQSEAILLFRREIENRLDAEFENLLTAASLDEQEEVQRVDREAEAFWWRQALVTGATALAAVAVCFLSGGLLARSLIRPISLLTQGTEAISRGELGHRIAYDSSDELGLLARRFNQMASVQEKQHGRLVSAQADLEHQVSTRTNELADANRRLTRLDQMRVEFLADISHELRTPLAGLRGEAEVTLRYGTKSEEVCRETLERIIAYASDMSRLVDDLLFLARSETDTVRFDFRRSTLQDIVMETVREGEVLGRSKNITIETDASPAPISVDVDAQRLKQAIMILLDNAIKYSPPERQVTVAVSAADGYGEVLVRDEGIGIPAEDLPRVFDRFYRGRTARVSHEGGSGLGLSISKWLVEKQGGELTIESQEGAFTEVRLRVPRVEVRALVQDPVS